MTTMLVGWCVVSLAFHLAHGLILGDLDTAPVNVTRTYSNDVYHLYKESTPSACPDRGNTTYMVAERQCIDGAQLINGCFFVFAPSGELSFSRLALFIENESTTAMTYSMNNTSTPAKVVTLDSRTQVNGSLCNIASLEVYRGRKHTFNISFRGLSLDDNGNIKITASEMVYDISEYIGEVYRMNFSCSNRYNGCLFFKVLGITDLTEAKFEGTVPGTLVGHGAESTTLSLTSTTENPFRFMNGSPLFYGVVGIGCVTITVISCLIILCLTLQCRNQYKRENKFILRNKPVVQVQRGQSTIYDDIVYRPDGTVVVGQSDSAHAEHNMNEAKADATTLNYDENGSGVESGDTKPPCARRPTEQYSTLVQVGGRNSFVNDNTPDVLINEENAYAQLNEI